MVHVTGYHDIALTASEEGEEGGRCTLSCIRGGSGGTRHRQPRRSPHCIKTMKDN